jgi:hypothetical protein
VRLRDEKVSGNGRDEEFGEEELEKNSQNQRTYWDGSNTLLNEITMIQEDSDGEKGD